MIRYLLALTAAWAASVSALANGVAELWAERIHSVVAIEFFTQTEMDRRPAFAYGTVIDDQGTIVLPGAALSNRATPAQLKDFRVYRPGQPASDYAAAEYLGVDPYTGWHFVRVAESARAGLIPITAFARTGGAVPAPADEVWGIGVRKKEEDFAPYFLSGRVSLVQSLPRRTAIATSEVSAPGLPVFNLQGEFIGLGAVGFGQSFLMFSERSRGGQGVLLVSPEECAAFVLAEEVLPHLDRIPGNVFGRPMVWLGAYGLEPLGAEAARLFQLEGQSGLVVSEVLEGSPAQKAGLQAGDIVLDLDGAPLPRLRPDEVLVTYFENEIDRRRPGETLGLTVLRGKERTVLTATLEDAPPSPREVERRYFENLGLTIRDFTYSDGVSRRAKVTEFNGVIAHFVKANTPISAAGLGTDDWIQQIDGVEITNFEQAVEKLAAIEADPTRREFVLLASRGGQTAVLRVKLL